MKKVVIFTEGLGEQIFIRQVLWHLIGAQNISFECFELFGDILQAVPYHYKAPNSRIHYQIINVGNDERVVGAIADRYEGFTRAGYEIVGIRDMYSAAYKRKSKQVDLQVIAYFVELNKNKLIFDKKPIKLFFAIMELEAWILAMYNILPRIDSQLTIEYIASQLSFDLSTVDTEEYFFNPAEELAKIFKLVGKEYKKHRGDMENIVNKMTDEDILEVMDSTRNASFKALLSELNRQFSETSIT